MNHPIAVNTKSIQGRRTLQFISLDEMVADAEKVAASPDTKMLGNWPLDQLLTHLATAINGSIDGMSAQAPWFIRLAAPLVKGRMLNRGMRAGFKLPREVESAFFPAAASKDAALDTLRRAVARLQNEKMTARHPVFGGLTHEEWTKLHLRHAELHLSFAVPGGA
ncbi:MAG TPA: DUF1569 domain-containing protein [Pirellulales bacterium]|nr:DUF1569 domain-containing protein [Pirellulales bacterium]